MKISCMPGSQMASDNDGYKPVAHWVEKTHLKFKSGHSRDHSLMKSGKEGGGGFFVTQDLGYRSVTEGGQKISKLV